MIQFNIEQLVPVFILNDKNGYALAKAIETGFLEFDRIIQQGVDCLLVIDSMPEWRLDEFAKEMNCPYDNFAPIETKRILIRLALATNRYYGTKGALQKYFEDLFGDTEIEEAHDYGGYPFHFRVTVNENWDSEKAALAAKIIDKVKNVRSVLDELRIGSNCKIAATAGGDLLVRFPYSYTSEALYTGTWPDPL